LIARRLLDSFAREMNKRVTDFLPSVAERLLNYDWPGNVRELRNVMERAVALTEFEKLIVDDLPERIRNYRQSTFRIDTSNPAELQTLEAVEQQYIRRVMESVQGNRTEAARILGVDRKTLYRRLKQDENS
jgi:two-component system response regulator HydG